MTSPLRDPSFDPLRPLGRIQLRGETVKPAAEKRLAAFDRLPRAMRDALNNATRIAWFNRRLDALASAPTDEALFKLWNSIARDANAARSAKHLQTFGDLKFFVPIPLFSLKKRAVAKNAARSETELLDLL